MTTFFIVLLIGWNAALSIQLYQVSKDNAGDSPTTTTTEVQQAKVDIASDVSELVSKSENKVVTVIATYGTQSVGSGSGAIYRIDTTGVYIITNNHVVAPVPSATT